VITFHVEVAGAREAAESLRAQGRRAADLSVPLAQAGFLLLLGIWRRITGKDSANAYSERYVEWLIRHQYWTGKLIGIVKGALIARSEPKEGATAAGEMETRPSPGAIEIGFLNPTGKIHGFLGWFKRKFGEEAIRADARDEAKIAEIFDHWLAERT
jgi:hypothetical protein